MDAMYRQRTAGHSWLGTVWLEGEADFVILEELMKDGRLAAHQGASCFFRPKYLISLLSNHAPHFVYKSILQF